MVKMSLPSTYDIIDIADVDQEHLEGLLALNEKLDLLRDKAEYLQMRYNERPLTWYEFRQYLPKENLQKETNSMDTGIATVLGVALGAVLAYTYRNVMPKRDEVGYLGAAIAGGSVGWAWSGWRAGQKQLQYLAPRLEKYDTYLTEFELAKKEGKDAGFLIEAIKKQRAQSPSPQNTR